eukprot:3937790-Rhodomonas_salina.7
MQHDTAATKKNITHPKGSGSHRMSAGNSALIDSQLQNTAGTLKIVPGPDHQTTQLEAHRRSRERRKRERRGREVGGQRVCRRVWV